jgi:uncharacterized protein (TIGR01777 family)
MANLETAQVLVSGVSGPIGAALLPALKASGARITRLMRNDSGRAAATEASIPWDPEQPLSTAAVSGFDAVIHLAGESIVGRWTESKKKKIRDSRVVGTENLASALAQAQNKPRVLVSSSAIGYYGNRGDEVLTESSPPGSGFLAEVCGQWEAATRAAADAGIRTVEIRTGVVLSSRGGALGKMLTPFKMGVGGRIGDGGQWMSWIDVQDLVRAVLHIVHSDVLHGPVNMVGPKPVKNAEFTQTLASVLHRPAIFPMPAFAVKLALGEMGETVLLGSQQVEPAQLVNSGFRFRFETLRDSLEHALG